MQLDVNLLHMSLIKKIIRLLIYVFYPLLKPVLRLAVKNPHSVKIVLIYRDKILLIRNSYRQGWTLPGGGIKRNESPRGAAIREVREEVGIDISSLTNHGKTKLDFETNSFVTIFSSKIKDAEFSVDGIEVEKAEWVDLKDLSNVDLLPVASHCVKYLKLFS